MRSTCCVRTARCARAGCRRLECHGGVRRAVARSGASPLGLLRRQQIRRRIGRPACSASAGRGVRRLAACLACATGDRAAGDCVAARTLAVGPWAGDAAAGRGAARYAGDACAASATCTSCIPQRCAQGRVGLGDSTFRVAGDGARIGDFLARGFGKAVGACLEAARSGIRTASADHHDLRFSHCRVVTNRPAGRLVALVREAGIAPMQEAGAPRHQRVGACLQRGGS